MLRRETNRRYHLNSQVGDQMLGKITSISLFVAIVTCLLAPTGASANAAIATATETLAWHALPPSRQSLAPPLKDQLKATRQKNSTSPSKEGASVLQAISRIQVQQNHHWRRVQYYSIYIQSADAARDYGRVTIPFNHYYTDLKLDFARVITAEGTQDVVSTDALQKRVTGGGLDFYSDTSEWVFSLPNVTVGSIIEFQYRHSSREIPVPGLFSERLTPHLFQKRVAGDSWRADEIKDFSFSLHFPKNLKIYHKSYFTFANVNEETEQASPNDEWQAMHWRQQNIAAIPIEGWMPPTHKLAPQLHLSTMDDWTKINRWAWSLIQPKLFLENSKKHLAQLNLPSNASELQKIKAVYAYLNKQIRYVYAHLGRGGYEPHAPIEVIKNGYGDCKDQSVLGISLLKALGVEAYPALVQTPNAGKYDTSLVSMMFDHMLIYIPRQGEDDIWLDTTGEQALFPGLSHYLPGSNVMVLGPRGGVIDTIPEPKTPNRARLSLRYRSDENKRTVVDLSLDFSGYFEQNLRNWWQDASEKDLSLQRFLHSLYNPNLGYEVKGAVHNSKNLWQGLSVEAQYKFNQRNTDNAQQAPMFRASFLQIYNLLGSSLSNLQPPGSRSHDYVDPQGYELEMDIVMQGDNYTVPAAIETSDNIQSRHFSLVQSASVKGDKFYINAKFKQPALYIEADDYDEFHRDMTKLREVKAWIVSMQKTRDAESHIVLDEIRHQYGESSFQFQKALAKHFIDTGKFEQALVPAQAAVKRNKKSGEAWYLLGMAQGFATLIDESTSSFERAESLGYFP